LIESPTLYPSYKLFLTNCLLACVLFPKMEHLFFLQLNYVKKGIYALSEDGKIQSYLYSIF